MICVKLRYGTKCAGSYPKTLDILEVGMNYYSAWTVSSVAKMVTEALKKTGDAGAFVVIGTIIGGGYFAYRKFRELEYRVRELEYQVKFGGK